MILSHALSLRIPSQIRHFFCFSTSSTTDASHQSASSYEMRSKYQKYLSNTKPEKLKVTRAFSEPQLRVSVPLNLLKPEDYEQKFENEWADKIVLFNIDPAWTTGMKRNFVRKHLEKNVYQGLSEPERFYTEENPDSQKMAEQLRFDETLFLCSDQKITPLIRKLNEQQISEFDKINQEELFEPMEHPEVQQRLIEIYDSEEPRRFQDRLIKELRVPRNMAKLIELATYNQNDIFFVGINEYALRNILSNYLSLNEVKSLFMKCLHYATTQTSDVNQFEELSRNLIYADNYHFLQKIENGEIMRKVKQISEWMKAEELDSEMILFAQPPTIETLDHYEIVNGIHQFKSPRKVMKEKDNDVGKIQKHALLEVMLGRLWTHKYTNNKFPYISEDYFQLSEADRANVGEILKQMYVKYLGAKEVFFQRNRKGSAAI